MRFLVVEDDSTCRKLLQLFLAPYGEVDEAEDGASGVDRFAAALKTGAPYHLVCMDIMLPGMDGQEALRRIRALETDRDPRAKAKVVMTTALDDPGNVVEAYHRGGADSYLPKPIDRDVFLDVLRHIGLIH
ncbi:response regulator [Desulfocurvus sp. DL9XJH121]